MLLQAWYFSMTDICLVAEAYDYASLRAFVDKVVRFAERKFIQYPYATTLYLIIRADPWTKRHLRQLLKNYNHGLKIELWGTKGTRHSRLIIRKVRARCGSRL